MTNQRKTTPPYQLTIFFPYSTTLFCLLSQQAVCRLSRVELTINPCKEIDMSNENKVENVGLLEAPGLILGNAVRFTTALSDTLVTTTSKLDGIAENLGEAAVLHSAIVKDAAEAKRMIAQFEHKALLVEIEKKYKSTPGANK